MPEKGWRRTLRKAAQGDPKDQGRRFGSIFCQASSRFPAFRKTSGPSRQWAAALGLRRTVRARRWCYRKILKIDDLLDGIACGEDAREGAESQTDRIRGPQAEVLSRDQL
jgi:hypothetical protein